MSSRARSDVVDVALLHGAWCGSWVWSAVATDLERAGLGVVAVDLPGEDASAGLSDYLATITSRLPAGGVTLAVGHSLAGILLEPLAAATPVQHLLYLTAFVPRPGQSLLDQWRDQPDLVHRRLGYGTTIDERRRTTWVDRGAARQALFADCPADVGEEAITMLRQQAWNVSTAVFDGELRTPSTVVTADDDRLLNSRALRASAARIEHASMLEIPGGHMPMISRPALLAALIRNVHA